MTETFSNSAHDCLAKSLRRALLRCAFAVTMMLCLSLAASAYTLVMRSGRRVEIPASFQVTRTALIYETAPTVSVTVQLVGIDIAATERANNEPSGSFLKRAERSLTQAFVATANINARTSARRSINTRDLEATRRTREASEAAYEQRRRELGLPSARESQQQTASETRDALELTRQRQANEADAEAYWRERATELREETAALDDEINYWRSRLAETPDTFVSGSYLFGNYPNVFVGGASSIITGIAPVPIRKPSFPALPLHNNRAGMWGANQQRAQLVGRIGFGGGSTRGRIFLNTAPPAMGWRSRGGFRAPLINNFPLATFAIPYPYGYQSYEREEIVARLYELEAQRAALQARQRELEDEARRAGALPGWLRP